MNRLIVTRFRIAAVVAALALLAAAATASATTSGGPPNPCTLVPPTLAKTTVGLGHVKATLQPRLETFGFTRVCTYDVPGGAVLQISTRRLAKSIFESTVHAQARPIVEAKGLGVSAWFYGNHWLTFWKGGTVVTIEIAALAGETVASMEAEARGLAKHIVAEL